MVYIGFVGNGTQREREDYTDEESGEPCLKKRVLAQREAAQQALVNMRESGNKQGPGSKTATTVSGTVTTIGAEPIPILPIPPYCLPSGDADLHSTSLPNNVHGICHSKHTVGDSIIAGSQFGGVIDTPVTTYENFAQGLPTKPTQKPPPKPKKKKAPATLSTPPASSDNTSDRLSAYIDMSQSQIGLIRSQFMSIAQTMTAIQNWMGTADNSSQKKRVPDANPNNPAYDISVTPNSTLPNASGQPASQPATCSSSDTTGNPLSTLPTNSDTNICANDTNAGNTMPSNGRNVQFNIANTNVQHITPGPTGPRLAQPPSGSFQYDVVLNGYPTARQASYPPTTKTGHMAQSHTNIRNLMTAYRTPIMSTKVNRGHGMSHGGINKYIPHIGHIHDLHNVHHNTFRPPAPHTYMDQSSHPQSLSSNMNCMNYPVPGYHQSSISPPPPYPTTYTYDVNSGYNGAWNNHHSHIRNCSSPDPYTYLANTGRPNERKIISGGMPIGWAVDRDIKERIWADLYVDFSELVQREDRSRRTVTVDSDLGTTVSVQKQAKEIKTIKEWDHAFAIYMNIYMELEANEKNIPHLVTYGQELKAMAENGLDFIAYDINFRKERESQVKAGYPPWNWNVFRQETFNHLQMTAIAEKLHLAPKAWSEPQNFKSPYSTSYFGNNSTVKSFKSGPENKPFLKVPPGFCYEFHSQDSNCIKPTCSFRHNCPCGRGPHTIYNCRTNGHPYRKRGNYGSRGRGGKSNTDHFKQ